ncbi:MAG: tryptophan--tRNA ligase [Deltaproteobacteria bacterium]|nr:tryptophan--tRNA ligase [Deltaproteobacteria bacterium]
MPTVLTGVKPSGTPHIGNYLGAIRPALGLADRYERSLLFIADYHALTTVQDAKEMTESIYDVAATWLACGVDPKRTLLYRQSSIPEVFELAWVLACTTAKGLLDRAHAFKDAEARGKHVNAGLYWYPVLMAADILLFDTTVVPVGKDQKQHIEIAREAAERFNHVFGETLVVPEPAIDENVMTIPGLDGEKMSKSYGNVIPLFASSKELRSLVMKIKTGSEALEDPKDPDTSLVYALYKAVATPDEARAAAERYRAGGMGWGHAKHELFERLDAELAGPRERYAKLSADRGYLDEVLAEGAARARRIAVETLWRVRKATGIDRAPV